ncbi:hypothetical protein [Bradyrhizobium sp. 33ap4]|uniref:hypothetical protein n=1 Tax=Bradyrhizobium sp. 33ap4 TaxID=3061630 RepID=UPI00292DFEFD|nr:hypothetical protein [Bradyrhizobium sp. 33ap4]
MSGKNDLLVIRRGLPIELGRNLAQKEAHRAIGERKIREDVEKRGYHWRKLASQIR